MTLQITNTKMSAIYYRLEGDRKFHSEQEEDVIKYAAKKHNLTSQQISELKQFGCTQNGKIGIMQFRLKPKNTKNN